MLVHSVNYDLTVFKVPVFLQKDGKHERLLMPDNSSLELTLDPEEPTG